MEWVLANHRPGYMKEKLASGISQSLCTQAQSCLPKLNKSCDEKPGLVDERTAAVIFPDFYQVFSTILLCAFVSISGWHSQNARREQTEHLLECWGSDQAGGETTGTQWGKAEDGEVRDASFPGGQQTYAALILTPDETKPRAIFSEQEDRPESPWEPSQCNTLGIIYKLHIYISREWFLSSLRSC